MADYDITTRVSFDPCALDTHEWRPSKLGLAKAIGADECAKCGETRIPAYVEAGGIDRTLNPSWVNKY